MRATPIDSPLLSCPDSAALAAANDPKAPPHPWIERDPTTGTQNFKIPLPPPETARRLAVALSAFADSLRSGMA